MKKIFITILMLLTIVSFIQPVFAADVLKSVCDNATNQTGSTPAICKDNNQQNPTNPVYSILKSVLNILSYAIGIIAVIVIVVAGLRLILSGGDPQTLNSARNAIIYAAVGIVVAALAQSIVVFALKNV